MIQMQSCQSVCQSVLQWQCVVYQSVPCIRVYVVRGRQCPRNLPKFCVRVPISKVFLNTILIFCKDASTFKETVGQQEPHLKCSCIEVASKKSIPLDHSSSSYSVIIKATKLVYESPGCWQPLSMLCIKVCAAYQSGCCSGTVYSVSSQWVMSNEPLIMKSIQYNY